MKRLAFNAVVVGAAVLLTLAVAEGALQLADFPPSNFSPWISDPATAYRFASNLDERMVRPEYDVRFQTNSLGMRDDEVGPKKGLRVLLLGDSFTCGYGVERGQMFADLLEQALGVEIVNAGVGGWEIVHQLHYYRDRGRRLAPDLVVYALYLANDLTRNEEWVEHAGNRLESRQRKYPVRLRYQFKLPALVSRLGYRLKEEKADRQSEWVPYPDYLSICQRSLGPEGTERYRTAERLLGELRTEVEASGARFLVALFSYRTVTEPPTRRRFLASRGDGGASLDLERPEREVTAFLDSIGVDYLRLNGPLRDAYQDQAPLYFHSDGHFTARGHRVVADAMTPVLRARLKGLR